MSVLPSIFVHQQHKKIGAKNSRCPGQDGAPLLIERIVYSVCQTRTQPREEEEEEENSKQQHRDLAAMCEGEIPQDATALSLSQS